MSEEWVVSELVRRMGMNVNGVDGNISMERERVSGHAEVWG